MHPHSEAYHIDCFLNVGFPVAALFTVINLVDDNIVLFLAVGRNIERREPGFVAVLGAGASTIVGTISTSSLNKEAELTVNAARASKPGRFSTELKLRSEKEKSITCGCFPQSYGPYEVHEKTLISVIYFICY